MYKIAIAGASTLLGKELKEALEDSLFAASEFVLLDESESLGQLDQVGDEITFVHAIEPAAFERVDFSFFCGGEELTRRHWEKAVAAGSTVLDLSGALDAVTSVPVLAPGLRREAPIDLLTPAVVPAHPAAMALALIMDRLQAKLPLRAVSATVLLPASEYGRAAMDELHQQTLNLLSFQSLPRAVFDAQTAYNLLSGLGEAAKVSVRETEGRIRRQLAALGGNRWQTPAVQAVLAPVFHGLAFSISAEFNRPVELHSVEEAMSGEHMDLIFEDSDSPSNLAATGQSDVLVRLRPETGGRNPNEAAKMWLWAAADNFRLAAKNALDCALELRRLRPQGTVQ